MTDVAIVALVPGIVELAKRLGLPSRWAGLAAVVAATALVALRDLALGDGHGGSLARWLLAGVVYGLAAAGLYSQARQLPSPRTSEELAAD
ncbi:MAG: hypothetical protein ACRDJH_13000 [Thermomicrobiales bacterium]